MGGVRVDARTRIGWIDPGLTVGNEDPELCEALRELHSFSAEDYIREITGGDSDKLKAFTATRYNDGWPDISLIPGSIGIFGSDRINPIYEAGEEQREMLRKVQEERENDDGEEQESDDGEERENDDE